MSTKDIKQLPSLKELNNFQRNGIEPDMRYQYELLSAKHIDRVVELFTSAFCHAEPMTQYLQMDEEKYKVFARSVTEKAVKDRLSVVALDKDKVIACALVEDIADAGAIPDFDPKFQYVLALLEQLGEAFFANKQFNKNHIAHLFITAVDENYRHQGLSTQVNFYAMDIAAKNDFQFIYCEFTHFYNEKGTIYHLKNRSRLIGSRVYCNFTLNHVKPFAYLDGGANSFLWEIQKNAKLVYKHHDKLVQEEF